MSKVFLRPGARAGRSETGWGGSTVHGGHSSPPALFLHILTPSAWTRLVAAPCSPNGLWRGNCVGERERVEDSSLPGSPWAWQSPSQRLSSPDIHLFSVSRPWRLRSFRDPLVQTWHRTGDSNSPRATASRPPEVSLSIFPTVSQITVAIAVCSKVLASVLRCPSCLSWGSVLNLR